MMEKRVLILLASMALLAAATAVTSANSSVTTRAMPARIVGTWGKTMTAATWQKNDVYVEQAGQWSIVITTRGLTSIFEPPGRPNAYPLTTMRAEAAGATVVFGPTADGYCANNASYQWTVSKRTLTFKALKDDCSARRVLMTAGLWVEK
jgi:hypothetical protein